MEDFELYTLWFITTLSACVLYKILMNFGTDFLVIAAGLIAAVWVVQWIRNKVMINRTLREFRKEME